MGSHLAAQPGLLLTWLVVSLALGTVFGYFTTSIDDLLGSNEAVQGSSPQAPRPRTTWSPPSW
ncbi:hypothetical protein [Actinomyces lilanjuaniae]|uniref:hypothetical protein n=1 Tax=Actinomyces lilanjuaniae TaxID=2321394 RepID=UPI0019692939|nr:hypothetical protein [Actinomyces lilanjuaniae]